MATGWGQEWGFLWPGDADSFDFDAFGKSKLWKQLDYAENVRKMVEVMAAVWAELDGATMSELARVGIDAATGDELDDWGLRLGPARNGTADDLYRRILKAEARKALGEGDVQTIYDIVTIFSPTAKATLMEGFPASWVIWLHFLTADEQKQVGALLDGVPGLGIGATAAIVDPAGVFQWGTASGPITKHWGSSAAPSSEQAGFASGVVIS